MPTLTEFFIDSVEFKFATCVFTDLSLTTVAPAGYYSDGAFIRYQTVTAGVGSLGPAQNSLNVVPNANDECPSCVTECQVNQNFSGNNIYAININKGSNTVGGLTLPPMLGIYNITTGLGTGPSSAGAVIARVWISNQYGAGVGLLLESGINVQSGGIAQYSSNNFSASGTVDFSSALTLEQQFADVLPGEPRLGGDDGGYQKNINEFVLDNDTDFLFVGHAATSPAAPGANANGGVIFQSGTAPCTTPDVMQVPNNSPNFTLSSVAGTSTTFTGIENRQFQFDSGSGQSAFSTFSTEDLTVDRKQVQFGPPSSFDNPGIIASGYSYAPGGYKGWFTAVVPRPISTTGDSFGARIRIAMLGCDAINNGATPSANMAAYGVKVNINCAEILEPISYLFENPFDPNGQSQTFYCSQPQDTEIGAFAQGEYNTLIYNVPGAIGTYAGADTQSIVVNEKGVPNRWDIVCSNPDGSGSINSTDTPKYVKYLNSQGQPRVFEVKNNIITQTNISFSPNPETCGNIIQTDSTKIGGGVYQMDYTTGTATGAVIIRIFTGPNPAGLFVKKLNISGDTVLERTNSFAVRGSQNITGELTEANYVLNSLSPNISQTGAIEGGSAYKLNDSAIELLPDDISIYNTDTTISTRAQRTIFYNDNIGSEIIAGGLNNIFSQQPYILPGGEIAAESAQVGSSFAATYDMFMYIGKLNQGNAPISYIPCTNLDNEVDCSMGFAPGGQGAQDSNFGGQINLPNSGSHEYNGNFGLLPNNPLEQEYLIIIGESGSGNDSFITVPAYLYPQAVTSCLEGNLRTNIYDGENNAFVSGTDSYLHVISPPQVQLYEGEDKSPGWIMAVIPKPEADDRLIRVEGVSITSNTDLTVKVECPAALPAISTTNVYKTTNTYSLSDYCTSGIGSQPAVACFIAHNSYGGNSDDPTTTTGAPCIPGVAGGTGVCSGQGALAVDIPYMNDMVFTDANGQTPLEDGEYFAPTGGNNLWFSVRLGVVRCIKDCTDLTLCNYA